MQRQALVVLGLVGPLVLGLAACGERGEPPSSMQAPDGSEADLTADLDIDGELVVEPGDEVVVRAQDNDFIDPHIQIEAGATVTWVNEGRQDHDVLAIEGEEWGIEVSDFAPGQTYEHTFDEPGVYPYYCTLHGTEDAGMIGTIVVE